MPNPRTAISLSYRLQLAFTINVSYRRLSTTASKNVRLETAASIENYLSKSSWSVRSLLPSSSDATTPSPDDPTPDTVAHLCRLSALPVPSTEAESVRLLAELKGQLHFVRHIQAVNTTGVVPLQSLRDASAAALKEGEIGMADEDIKKAMGREETVGKWVKRVRRKQVDYKVIEQDGEAEQEGHTDAWDPLAMAEKKRGRFFVVEGAGRETDGGG